MSAKRILFVVTEDWYFWSHRRQLASAALQAGWQVGLATHVTEYQQRIAALGVKVYPLPWDRGALNPLKEARTALALAHAMRHFEPSIVHNVALKPILHNVWYPRRARVINAVTGLGYVFIDGDRAGQGKSARRSWLQRVVRIALRRALSRNGAHTVVQNSDDAQIVESLGVTPERLHLIEGVGVDLGDYQPFAEPPGPIRVALVARMLWDKGVQEAVDAARYLRSRDVNVIVELVGAPDPANRASVSQAQLERWRSEGLIEWNGWSDDVRSVWQRAHIAILPSYREGFPKALIEAAACGRALIATDTPGCRAIVEPGHNGELVICRDAASLAGAIEKLASDHELRQRYGANARETVARRFGLPVIVERFHALYRSLEVMP